jgi:hypothetical protein
MIVRCYLRVCLQRRGTLHVIRQKAPPGGRSKLTVEVNVGGRGCESTEADNGGPFWVYSLALA